jgi:hypothetical protein
VDLSVFLGSALLSFAALALGHWAGALDGETPDWAWIPAVLLVDVAHVWSTGFIVYTDRAELRRRPLLYALVPLSALAIGIALYSEGALLFWRCLAYLAVFHFARQQYGWVMLYRARAGETEGRFTDACAVYAATLYPLVWWHTHLPRHFWWFVPNDFLSLRAGIEPVCRVLYVSILAVYALAALDQLRRRAFNTGKHLVVASTALTWYVGIILLNSDYAFTVMNVFVHGIPYIALALWYGRARGLPLLRSGSKLGALAFVGALWAIAFAEELVWDRAAWHERAWLFGAPWSIESYKVVLVPLLAVPQATHYVLDGFLWRRGSPQLRAVFAASTSS